MDAKMGVKKELRCRPPDIKIPGGEKKKNDSFCMIQGYLIYLK